MERWGYFWGYRAVAKSDTTSADTPPSTLPNSRFAKTVTEGMVIASELTLSTRFVIER